MRVRLVIAVAAAVAAAGLGTGLGIGLGGGSSPSPSTTAGASELASIRTGCEEWLRTTATRAGTAQWCTEMTQWMDSYMGANGYGPQMMWGDPGRLRAACEHWWRTRPRAGAQTDAAGWCEGMAAWMTTHFDRWNDGGTWGSWMRSGPMMGSGSGSGAPAPRLTGANPAATARAPGALSGTAGASPGHAAAA